MVEPFTRIGQHLEHALQPLQDEMHRTQRRLKLFLQGLVIPAPLSGIFGELPETLAWPSHAEFTELGLHRLTLPVEAGQQLANLGHQWNCLIPPIPPWPAELRAALHRQQQEFQVWQRQIAADMEARPEYYQNLRDVMTLLHVRFETDDRLNPEEYQAAVYRLASRIAPKLANPRAQQALKQLAAEIGERPAEILRKRILPVAVLLVIDAIATPQRIQLGRQRLKDDTGRWLSTPPVHLLLYQVERFFRQQIRNAAEAILLDQPYPLPQRRHDLEVTARRKGAADEGLLVSYDQAEVEQYRRYGRDPSLFPTPERYLETKSLIITLDAASTPQEKTYLLKLADGASRQEITAEMRISQENSRQILHRIREKARRLL